MSEDGEKSPRMCKGQEGEEGRYTLYRVKVHNVCELSWQCDVATKTVSQTSLLTISQILEKKKPHRSPEPFIYQTDPTIHDTSGLTHRLTHFPPSETKSSGSNHLIRHPPSGFNTSHSFLVQLVRKLIATACIYCVALHQQEGAASASFPPEHIQASGFSSFRNISSQ